MRRIIWTAAAVWLLGLAGCGLAPQRPRAEDCQDAGLVFRDDFSAAEACGWALYDSGTERVAIANGVLTINTSTSGFLAWTNPGLTLADVDVTAQTRVISGPNDNAYGLICRYQDEDNFYLFVVSSDGYYAVGKFTGGTNQVQYLTGTPPNHYVASDAINRGAATNQLRARCVGDRLSLFVNGFLLADFTDADGPQTGDIGLAAGTFESGAFFVEFDDVRVTAP